MHGGEYGRQLAGAQLRVQLMQPSLQRGIIAAASGDRVGVVAFHAAGQAHECRVIGRFEQRNFGQQNAKFVTCQCVLAQGFSQVWALAYLHSQCVALCIGECLEHGGVEIGFAKQGARAVFGNVSAFDGA